uniref:Uncharacterized protein n=1 Tax=Arundo donax TaxID=35708 RepID=A0A0A9G630_ARUDO
MRQKQVLHNSLVPKVFVTNVGHILKEAPSLLLYTQLKRSERVLRQRQTWHLRWHVCGSVNLLRQLLYVDLKPFLHLI